MLAHLLAMTEVTRQTPQMQESRRRKQKWILGKMPQMQESPQRILRETILLAQNLWIATPINRLAMTAPLVIASVAKQSTILAQNKRSTAFVEKLHHLC